jgi:hypothetical protein
MKLSLYFSTFALVTAQRKKSKNKKNRPKATQAPRFIALPSRAEPGLPDNRQTIAEMLHHQLGYYGLDQSSFIDVLSSGCWCNMIGNYEKRKGQPVGSLDISCRAQNHCYRCIGMDFGCDPLNSPYTVVIDPDSYELTCEQNTNPCALNACLCDLDFINNIIQNISEEGSNVSGLTESGGFNTLATCVGSGSGGPKAEQCCGDFPKRFPFSDNYGQRSCCAGKTFNTNTLECCAGGEIKGIGYC